MGFIIQCVMNVCVSRQRMIQTLHFLTPNLTQWFFMPNSNHHKENTRKSKRAIGVYSSDLPPPPPPSPTTTWTSTAVSVRCLDNTGRYLGDALLGECCAFSTRLCRFEDKIGDIFIHANTDIGSIQISVYNSLLQFGCAFYVDW